MTIAPPPELFSHEFMVDPYPTYAWLRREAPVYWSEPLANFVITRYDDCATVLSRPDQFGPLPESHPGREPADHVHYRNIIARAFDAEFVASLQPKIEHLVDQLIDPFIRLGVVDLIEAVARPLPTLVLAEIFGVPRSEWPIFKGWAERYSAAMNGGLDAQATNEFRQTIRELVAYFAYLSEHRRRHPGDDLITRLIAAELDGSKLTAAEILGLCEQLMVAGRDLTSGLIGNCLRALFTFPEQLERLNTQPSLLEAAIEETLRWDSPVLAQPRRTRAEIMLRGVRLPAEADLLVVFAAANRDPDVFPEPDQFDIVRSNASRHLAFGRGIHFCLGAPLARLEARVALQTLFERLPRMRLAPDKPPARRFADAMLNLRTLQSLHVAFSV